MDEPRWRAEGAKAEAKKEWAGDVAASCFVLGAGSDGIEADDEDA